MHNTDEKEYDFKNLDLKLKNLEKFIQNSSQNHSKQKNIIEKLIKALEAAPVVIWEWQLTTNAIVFDENIRNLLGYDDKFDLIQNDWSKVISPSYIEKIGVIKDRCIIDPSFKGTLLLKGIDSTGNHCNMIWSARYAENNTLTGTFVQIQDFSPDATLDVTLQNIPIGVLVFDHTGKVIMINPATRKILGIREDNQIVGFNIADFSPFKESGIVHYFFDLAEKNLEFDFESPAIQNLTGKQIFLQLRGFERNQSDLHLLLITDITKRKNLEDQYRQLQRLESIGKLAGGIAHDFNNILTVIKGSAAFALTGMEEGNPAYDNLYNIQKASERAESLTQQLLAFSRRQLLQPKVLNLNDLILNIKARLESLIGSHIRIITNLDKDAESVKADQEQIENVIVNLALNARDAMPDGGTLTIETSRVTLDENYMRGRPLVKPGPYIMLGVSDTGCGMDKAVEAHIFEPFFTTKEKGLGSGMGLATVYGVVKQSSGYIWVYSEIDQGSTFKIYLPRVTDSPQSAEMSTPAEDDLKGTETVLVVDDEAEVRNLVSEMLRFYGYKVMEAPNAANALMIFEKYKETIDIVLTDVVMPQMSGLDLVEKLLPNYPDTKVLFMSGYTDNVIVEHGLLDKNKNFIQKPFNAKALIQKVREILNDSSGRMGGDHQ